MNPVPVATNLLALDVGEKRIGVARVNTIARLPEALTTITNDADFQAHLSRVIQEYAIDLIVVGVPRNLQGELTAQSEYVYAFCREHLNDIGIPLVFQDETLTSVVAEEALGRVAREHKGLVDAEAARLILQDYLGDHHEI